MDSNLRREIIIDNYQNPFNKELIGDESYIRVNVNNESCIDNIDLMVKITDEIIEDIRFDGDACAITTSATSIMIKSLIGKNLTEVEKVIENYERMINEKDYDKGILGELNVYDEIYKQANRKKCALMPFVAIKKVLNIYYNNRKSD